MADLIQLMKNFKFIAFIHRSMGILGILILCLFTIRLFFIKEYIFASIYAGIVIFSIYWAVKNYANSEKIYGANYGTIFCLIMPCWLQYSDYKRDERIEKYGMVYNKTRQSLGIPIIPPGWHIERKSKLYVDWEGNASVMGHERKSIYFDSLYKIESEYDVYNFKAMHDTVQSLSVEFKYARAKSRDSIFYLYHLKDTTLNISRQQADSIFDAQKIGKD